MSNLVSKKIKTTVRIETTKYLSLDKQDIICVLKELKYIPESASNITVEITIPGGGDYSNTVLGIDTLIPLEVAFKIIEER